jgi:hypothetical protein
MILWKFENWFVRNRNKRDDFWRYNQRIFDKFRWRSRKDKSRTIFKILTQECIDDFIQININVIKVFLRKSKVEINKDEITSNFRFLWKSRIFLIVRSIQMWIRQILSFSKRQKTRKIWILTSTIIENRNIKKIFARL